MSQKRSYEELVEQVGQLRTENYNLRKIYEQQKQAAVSWREKYKEEKEKRLILENTVKEQTKQIEKLGQELESLKKMMFATRKRKKEDKYEIQSYKKEKTPITRSPSSYQRAIPLNEEITTTEGITITNCPVCNTPLINKKKTIKYVEDIRVPEYGKPTKVIVKYEIESGYCPHCQKRGHRYPLSPHTVNIGPNTKHFIVYATTILRLGYEQIQNILLAMYQLSISKGEITNILEEEAEKLSPEYHQLRKKIQGEKGVHYDETTRTVQQEEYGGYAWCMNAVGKNEVYFELGRTRGKRVAENMRGEEKEQHVGITDDYVGYKNVFGKHQLCWAHLHRKLRELAECKTYQGVSHGNCLATYKTFSILYSQLRKQLEQPFEKEKWQRIRENMIQVYQKVFMVHKNDPQKLKTYKETALKECEKYFTCLEYKGIPCDNNKAERVLRPIVLKRKNCFGSKTQKGAEVLAVLLSIAHSLRNESKHNFFQNYANLSADYGLI